MGQFGIGQPVRRFEDKRLLSGNGRFQNDVNLSGQAYGYVLRSPHAHAAIRKMDLSAALAALGVLAIYTGDDLAAAGMGTMGVPFANNRKRPDGSPMFWRAHLGAEVSLKDFLDRPTIRGLGGLVEAAYLSSASPSELDAMLGLMDGEDGARAEES